MPYVLGQCSVFKSKTTLSKWTRNRAVSTLLCLTIPPNARKMEAPEYLIFQIEVDCSPGYQSPTSKDLRDVLSEGFWILHGFEGRVPVQAKAKSNERLSWSLFVCPPHHPRVRMPVAAACMHLAGIHAGRPCYSDTCSGACMSARPNFALHCL